MKTDYSDGFLLETHLHTKGNSGCAHASAKKIAKRYTKAGYDGIVCTNHFNYNLFDGYYKGETTEEKLDFFLAGYRALKHYCGRRNIKVFFGMELALRGSEYCFSEKCSEILVFGITPEEFLRYNVALPDMTLEQLYNTANREGWLLVQAHPYRAHTEVLDTHFLHGIEIYNHHPGHDSKNSLAEKLAKDNGLLGLSGSDYHFKFGNGGGIILPRAPRDEKDLVALIKENDFAVYRKK